MGRREERLISPFLTLQGLSERILTLTIGSVEIQRPSREHLSDFCGKDREDNPLPRQTYLESLSQILSNRTPSDKVILTPACSTEWRYWSILCAGTVQLFKFETHYHRRQFLRTRIEIAVFTVRLTTGLELSHKALIPMISIRSMEDIAISGPIPSQ